MDPNLFFAVLGALLGVAGGIVGTCASVANTTGATERAYVVRAAIVCWISVAIFALLMFISPNPLRGLLWIPYCLWLTFCIRRWNAEQSRIRAGEARTQTAGEQGIQ